jgi:agmatine deiminase
MPAEWRAHERTLMCWPARRSLWGEHWEQAEGDHAEIANAIAAFEPVLMAVDPAHLAAAEPRVGARVELAAIPLDDSWARDSGPVFVFDEARGERAGVCFGFDGWGGKYAPHDRDAAFAGRVLAHLGEVARDARALVLEGGSIATDGAGTFLTTEQCLLRGGRNPGLDREALEAALARELGATRVLWLGEGLVEDRDTDGHVDNVCAFTAPGRVLLQTAPPGNPNHAAGVENARRLAAAGLEVVELPWLPYVAGEAPPVAVPYLNFYVCNGAVIVPVTGAETDGDALALIGAQFPGREIVPVPGRTLALGGGGVHCITQPVPALG